jgi:hypothetical protein
LALGDYTKNPTWQDGVTPILEEHLQKFDDQIYDATEAIQALAKESLVPPVPMEKLALLARKVILVLLVAPRSS